jgi:uncharacterized protein YkwD
MLRLLLLASSLFITISSFSQVKTNKKPVTKAIKKPVKPTGAKVAANPSVVKKPSAKTTAPKPVVSSVPVKKEVVTAPPKVEPKPEAKEAVVLKMAVREQEMLNEINFVRTKPNEYKKFIIDYLQNRNPDNNSRKAATELVKQLEDMSPIAPVQFSDYLYQQAKVHGQWMEDADAIEHSAFNNAENLVAGTTNIRDAIILLLIDVTDSQRGHRKNILHPGYKYVGVCEVKGSVAGMKGIFVQEFNFKQ